MTKTRRAALYLRVSTDGQTVENQRLALETAAGHRGWPVVATYIDAGVSGAKGRDKRPEFDRMMKDAVRRKFDVVMAWAVDRLGRSTALAATTLSELHAVGVDVYVDRQAVDTTTPGGKAMFHMAGVFAELERDLIRERVMAGLQRARAQGKRLGRPTVGAKVERAVRERLARGEGILKVARALGVGSGTVQRIKRGAAAEP